MKSYGGVGLTTITWPTVLPAGPASAQSSSYLPRVEGRFMHTHNSVRVDCSACAADRQLHTPSPQAP